MTLIVARKENGKVYVVGDTLVTKLNGERFSYEKCIVKTVLINIQCCVCFSGNVEAANKAIAHLIDKNYDDVNKVLSYLEKVHNKCGQGVDFGVVTNINKNISLHSLKSGEVLVDVDQFWLGENYNEFQTVLGGSYNNSLKNKMQDAMLTLIQDGNLNSIGGFDLSISSDDESFQMECEGVVHPVSGLSYDVSVYHNFNCPQFISFKSKGDFRRVEGKANDSVSVFSSINPCLPAVGIHYRHANYGYLFCPHLRINMGQPELALEPFIYKNIEPRLFVERIFFDHAVGLKGFIIEDDGTLVFHGQR